MSRQTISDYLGALFHTCKTLEDAQYHARQLEKLGYLVTVREPGFTRSRNRTKYEVYAKYQKDY